MNEVAFEAVKKKIVSRKIRNSAKKSWTMRLSAALTIFGTGFGFFLDQFTFYREKLPEGMVLWAVPVVSLIFGLTRFYGILKTIKASES